jgi:hypothetical protein
LDLRREGGGVMREVISGFFFACAILVLLGVGVVVGILCVFIIMIHGVWATPLLLILPLYISIAMYLMDRLP